MSVSSKGELVPVTFPSASTLRDVVPQPQLFPLRATLELQNTVPGADVWGTVIADDGKVYFVKGSKGGALVRASEWVGTLVADALNLSCAMPQVVQMTSGDLLFGSPQIVGAANAVETTQLLTSLTIPPHPQIPGLQRSLSEIYVLDLFLNNGDRHDQNFVLVRNGSAARLYVIDFARCLFWNNSFDAFPAANQQTVVRGKEFRRRHGFDTVSAREMIDRIAALSEDLVVGFLSRMPQEWLPDERRRELVGWWGGEGRLRKLEALRKGLENGTLP